MKQIGYEELTFRVNPEDFDFEFISEYAPGLSGVFAQERAEKALDIGLGIKSSGFNCYVAGVQETGALDLVMAKLKKFVENQDYSPKDLCYIYNFKDPDIPIAVLLEQGYGNQLKKDMMELVDNLKLHLPKSFEGEAYLVRKEEVIREFNKKRSEAFEELDKKVKEKGFLLQADPTGMMVIPAKDDGTPLSPDEINKMDKEKQDELKRRSEELHREMGATMRLVHQLEQQVQQELKELDRQVARQTATMLIEPLKRKYQKYDKLISYFDQVLEHVVIYFRDFLPQKPQAPGGLPFPMPGAGPDLSKYDVNVLVDNSESKGRPFVFESNPSYTNLFGVIERQAQFGALLTDFTMIKAGSLHRANGGFLVIKVLDLLKKPFSYEALKRALRTNKIEIEDLGEQLGLFTTKTLKPEPVELDVKIILMGEPHLYHMLYSLDPDFKELFKIKSHLDIDTDNDEARKEQFISTISNLREKRGLKDLHRTAVARLIEYATELSGSKDKLTLKVTELEDLMVEADFWARQEGDPFIKGRHIKKAISEKIYRSSLYQEKIQELLLKDIIKVSTEGEAVGQINGLAVYNLGDATFGKPSRITVNISLGKDGVVNIDREAELSGKIHTKGVMILAGYLRSRFAFNKPLSLTATICFEQSYGMIDGDSASGAELFALLSALGNVPLRQDVACTGAVSQKGEILPVGGVKEKIEGFFDLCNKRGLTGTQGVIIPEANRRNLLLKDEVVEAVKKGMFHIWSIETVEEGVEILTGMKAGTLDDNGKYPEGTLFHLVDENIERLSKLAKEQAEEDKEGKNKELK